MSTYSIPSGFDPVMPKSLPVSFTKPFVSLVHCAEALPMRFDRGGTGIGERRNWNLPLAPLMRIDGAPKPGTIPALSMDMYEIESTAERGFISDWKWLNNMFDRRVYSRTYSKSPGQGCGEVNTHDALTEGTARKLLYDDWGSQNLGSIEQYYRARIPSSWEGDTYKIDYASNEMELEELAFSCLFHAALLKGYRFEKLFKSDEEPAVCIERTLLGSVKCFLGLKRPAAAAMVLDMMSRDYRINSRENVIYRLAAADAWAESLRSDHDPRTFGYRLERALNGAQLVYSDGTLEDIFRATVGYNVEVEDKKELVKSYLRAAWARFQKARAPQRRLRPGESGTTPRLKQRRMSFRASDWLQVADDLGNAARIFRDMAARWEVDKANELIIAAETHAKRAQASQL